MFGKVHEVSGMKITVSINDGINIPMTQTAAVWMTCVMDGQRVDKVYADQGITFQTEGGFLSHHMGAGLDITEYCNKAELARQIKTREEENDMTKIHNKGA